MSRAALWVMAAAVALASACEVKRARYCEKNTDCASGICDSRTMGCVTAEGSPVCLADSDCGESRQVCEASSGRCVGCLNNEQCAGAAGGPVCHPSTKTCVQCTGNAQCPAARPICEASACRVCRQDSECASGPGVCLPGGSCATDAQVVFVEFNAAGCPEGDGSAAAPFCAPSDAVAALTSTRATIVIRGPVDDGLTLTAPPAPVLVLGKKNAADLDASIPIGAAAGISISGGEILIRDLAVTNGTNPASQGIVVTGEETSVTLSRVRVADNAGMGIEASGGAALHMDRCFVEENQVGGVLIDGASFDISNTVLAGNGYGIQFSATAPSDTGRFWFNTVVGNSGAAICDPQNPQTLASSIVVGLNVNCTLAGSVTTAPTFDPARPYHLTAKLPCPEGAPAAAPDHDLDGDPRTAPIDCGADQR